jgi:hypothetical protein
MILRPRGEVGIMSDETKKEPPEAVRNIVEAMIGQALARCDREGIAWSDFYLAMKEERKVRSTGDLADLLERTFRRLSGASN